MHRVAPRIDYSCIWETVQQMVVIEQVTPAEFKAVLPLLEQFFALYSQRAQGRLASGRIVK
jgi:hypothetical protein